MKLRAALIAVYFSELSDNAAVYVQMCGGCGVNIEAGRMAIVVSKAKSDDASKSTWHVTCFKCCACQQLLVDLCCCYKAGSVYCERHYAELMRPRCRGCDEVSSYYTNSVLIVPVYTSASFKEN